MKKSIKIILIILGIWLIMFVTDFICIKKIDRPIFMLNIINYKDGGTKEYYGIFYKVIDYNVIDGDDSIHIGTWFMKYNPSKVCTDYTTDAYTFSNEYGVTTDNVFVYKSIDEIVNVLKHGTGVIYLGFPECPWCKAYVPMLNDVAVTKGLEKIYYFNILEDRRNNTSEYLEIVSLLNDYLRYDDAGNKRIYVPTVIAVLNGEIVGFDDETSYDTHNLSNPSDYWNDEEITDLKEKLTTMIEKILSSTCTSCNKQ